MQDSIVRFENVSMQFPGVLANDHVSFDLKKGEVFALVGENGAEAELVGGRELAGVGIFRNSDVHNDTS